MQPEFKNNRAYISNISYNSKNDLKILTDITSD